jgi:hypothetical protein
MFEKSRETATCMTAFLTSAKCHPPKQHLLLLDSRRTDVLMFSAYKFFYDIDVDFYQLTKKCQNVVSFNVCQMMSWMLKP